MPTSTLMRLCSRRIDDDRFWVDILRQLHLGWDGWGHRASIVVVPTAVTAPATRSCVVTTVSFEKVLSWSAEPKPTLTTMPPGAARDMLLGPIASSTVVAPWPTFTVSVPEH